jgi:hypothetical protein
MKTQIPTYVMAEALRLTSYSSHSGQTSKMWIMPDGKVISIRRQHYEWALENRQRLRDCYGIRLERIRPEDDPIRLHLLGKGCARVNYEHRGGTLTVEAHYRFWKRAQERSLRAILLANAGDIFFVRVRLLTRRGWVVSEEFKRLVG